MSRTCPSCNTLKSDGEFYKSSRNRNGLSCYCKECKKKKSREDRKKNPEHYRAYDEKRNSTEERKAMFKSYSDSERSKMMRRLSNAAYSSKNSMAVEAHTAVRDAIYSGVMVRPDHCSQCGKKCSPDAHHDDYSLPLSVRWLCRKCHCKHHSLTSKKDSTSSTSNQSSGSSL